MLLQFGWPFLCQPSQLRYSQYAAGLEKMPPSLDSPLESDVVDCAFGPDGVERALFEGKCIHGGGKRLDAFAQPLPFRCNFKLVKELRQQIDRCNAGIEFSRQNKRR